MSLTWCENCQSLEPDTREANDDEKREAGVELDEDLTVCEGCDSSDGLSNVPEHDDYDMDR